MFYSTVLKLYYKNILFYLFFIESLEKARRKANLALNQSDLSTNNDNSY